MPDHLFAGLWRDVSQLLCPLGRKMVAMLEHELCAGLFGSRSVQVSALHTRVLRAGASVVTHVCWVQGHAPSHTRVLRQTSNETMKRDTGSLGHIINRQCNCFVLMFPPTNNACTRTMLTTAVIINIRPGVVADVAHAGTNGDEIPITTVFRLLYEAFNEEKKRLRGQMFTRNIMQMALAAPLLIWKFSKLCSDFVLICRLY